MAAPNLKDPTSVIGKTEGFLPTTTLSAMLSNDSASGKVLKVSTAYCSNIDGSIAAAIDLSLYNGTIDRHISKGISVPTNATQLLITKEAPVYIEEGQSLRARSSVDNALELVISYEDIS